MKNYHDFIDMTFIKAISIAAKEHLNTRSRILNITIKLILILIFAWLIYSQVFLKKDLELIKTEFLKQLSESNFLWFAFTILLMPLNWAFETLKWRELEEKVQHLNFWESFRAVLAGVAFSIFTPNRIGEYGGRVLFVKPENQLKTIVATLVGSYSQLLVSISFGYLGFIYVAAYYWKIEPYIYQGIVFAVLLLIFLLLFGYFNVDLIAKVARRINWHKRIKKLGKPIRILRNYNNKDLGRALLFAFLRYVTYSIQYFFLLRFFGVDVTLFTGLACIATVFLIQTSIPLDPITGLMARGKVALNIWGLFSNNEVSILAATFALWIINLLIPSLLGMMFILNLNILKSLGYEKNG